MKIAAISDIHGNCLALETALADIKTRAVDQIVCLGDAVQGGPQPAETVAVLQGVNCPIVMGNADAWMLSGNETGATNHFTDRQRVVREWSMARLSETDQNFIRNLHFLIRLELGPEQQLACFHGSPQNCDDLILPETPEAEFRRMLSPHLSAFCCGGHTHRQQIRRIDETFFFNPGSVGLCYDRSQPATQERKFDPWIEYAILTINGDQVHLEFCRLPLDVDHYVDILKTSGHPYAERIANGYGRSLES